MFGIYDQLPRTEAARRKHAECLREVLGDQRATLDHMYSCLSIIDSKCASLLGNNSIWMAVYAVFLCGSMTMKGICAHVVMWCGILLLTWSSILLMQVVWIYWSTPDDLSSMEKQIDKLLEVRAARTIKYRWAWWCSHLSLAMLLIAMLLHQCSGRL